MHGILPSSLTDTLSKVPVHLDRKPVRSFNLAEAMGEKVCDYLRARFDSSGDPALHISWLPIEAYRKLSVDQAAKTAFSSDFSLDSKVESSLHENPTHRLVYKIRSSIWRWGMTHAGWNEVVDAYEGLKAFSLDHAGFDIAIDYTTSVNERGYAEHSRTYLDGVFAFLVHYKGEHVMTIGFSIMSGRRLLLQQVQLKQPRGNRWLFKLPSNRIEFIIDRLVAAFPRYRIHIADGGDIAGTSLASYRTGYAKAKQQLETYTKRLADNDNADETEYLIRYRDEAAEAKRVLRSKITGLKADLPRLAAFYRDSGRYAQGEALKVNGITHYALAA